MIVLLVQPVFIGPNIQVVSTVPNHRVVMRCQFESYPPPEIHWIKMSRTVHDPEGRVLAVDVDTGVNDITTKQLSSILFESVLSYTPTERDFGLSFECRASNPRVGRHSFTLQRAEPPKKVQVTEVKPLTNGVEIFVQNPETGGLPILEYTLKYNSAEKSDEQPQTITIPAQISPDNAQQNQVLKIDKIKPSTSYRLTITAKSRAGVGQPNGPITFRTLDRQVPDFKIVKADENKNETCSNDRTCVVQWAIESDGGAPIIRSEIFYAKVIQTRKHLNLIFIKNFQAKSDKGFDIDGSFSTPALVDASVSEYELTNLKPATSYIVVVKLFNEAGPNEQKARITTLKDSGMIYQSKI